MPKRLTQEEFIKRAKEKYGDKFTYNKVKFVDMKTKVIVTCCIHGDLEVEPKAFLSLRNKSGCKYCARDAQRDTTENFIEQAKKIHGDNFDYSKVNYINRFTKINIKCNNCGKDFWQTPHAHLRAGCPCCFGRNKTTEEFIEQAKKIHGDKYDYSETEYVGAKNKLKIRCNTCGNIFEQTPSKHLLGQGCPFCNKHAKITPEFFLERAKEIHGDKYQYDLSNLNNNKSYIKIFCPEHGWFEQKVSNHLNQKNGCPKCYGNVRKTTEEFIEQAKKIHGDKYDYSKVEYKNNCTKIEIICPKHGSFWIRPADHLNGQGCSECKNSKGENRIKSFLDSKNIKYNHNIECLDWLSPQKPDFYLPDYNLVIEYDGEFHYILSRFSNAEEILLKNQNNDKRKNKLCEEHGVEVLRIPYWDFENIEKILEKRLLND